jgi:hypothetical protein
MVKRHQTRVGLCALFAQFLLPSILLPTGGYAQSTFGDIRGTVRDPGGLVLPQAMVTLHSLDENTTRSALTDGVGNYLFENLKPGHYEVSAVKEGFANSSTIAVELDARQMPAWTLACRWLKCSKP